VTLLTNSFEGLADATALTIANSATGGDAFQEVTGVASGQTQEIDTAIAGGDGTAAALKLATGATSTTSYVGWTTAMGTRQEVWGRCYLYFTANPTSNISVGRLIGAAASIRGSIVVNTGGLLKILTNTGTQAATLVGTIPLNAWFRVEWRYLVDTTSAGTAEVRLYSTPSSTTVTESVSATAITNGGTDITTYRTGHAQANAANVGPFWMDGLALSDTGWIGPASEGTNVTYQHAVQIG